MGGQVIRVGGSMFRRTVRSVPWITNADGRQAWSCELCAQVVQGVGPWCALYNRWPRELCRPIVKQALHNADARGDGALANALCWFGRARWGTDLDW